MRNLPHLKKRRQELRNNATAAEATLWTLLRKRQVLGLKFRRQYSIYNYIVDFCCVEKKLIIELDGEVHNDPIINTNDYHRDQKLKALGYTVLRFENDTVYLHPEGIVEAIRGVVER
ncbi:endonuclease domain-containing protein [Roseivirga sp. BDSF3-8]|uniref:endonuclease domain-containing protein n=1 Tax=Roseivirga sp. BDSF3-8 TaxID=3241598 RepID=UPI0035324034